LEFNVSNYVDVGFGFEVGSSANIRFGLEDGKRTMRP
jgi:hypothetical protein